jgi:hypothetical protein
MTMPRGVPNKKLAAEAGANATNAESARRKAPGGAGAGGGGTAGTNLGSFSPPSYVDRMKPRDAWIHGQGFSQGLMHAQGGGRGGGGTGSTTRSTGTGKQGATGQQTQPTQS